MWPFGSNLPDANKAHEQALETETAALKKGAIAWQKEAFEDCQKKIKRAIRQGELFTTCAEWGTPLSTENIKYFEAKGYRVEPAHGSRANHISWDNGKK